MRALNADDAGHSHAIVRWLAVVPAAVLAGWVAHVACGMLSMAVASTLSESASLYVRLLLYYAPKDAAFVIAGAKIAPRPLATAVALAVAATAISLMVHILVPRTVGVTNYLHFAAESAGAIFGAALTYATTRTHRDESTKSPGQ